MSSGSDHDRVVLTCPSALRIRRQHLALQSLSRVPPNSVEARDLHSFYLENKDVDESVRVWTSETRQEKTMLMFPQERKYVHGLLFYV